VRIKPLHH